MFYLQDCVNVHCICSWSLIQLSDGLDRQSLFDYQQKAKTLFQINPFKCKTWAHFYICMFSFSCHGFVLWLLLHTLPFGKSHQKLLVLFEHVYMDFMIWNYISNFENVSIYSYPMLPSNCLYMCGLVGLSRVVEPPFLDVLIFIFDSSCLS